MRKSATFTGHKGPVYALAPGRTPESFLSGSGDGLVVQWQLDKPDDGRLLVNVGQAVFSLCPLPGHGLLMIGTEGGRLHVVDMDSRKELRLFEVHQRGIFRIVHLGGERVACAGGDGSLSIWTIGNDRQMTLLRQIPLVEEKLRDLALSPDGELLAVACGDGQVRVLDTEHFNEQHTLQAHPTEVTMDTPAGMIGATALAWHPGKPALLSGGKDGHLRVWRSHADFTALHALAAHEAAVYQIAFGPDGTRFATAGRDKRLKIWHAGTLDPLARLDNKAGGHSHSVNCLHWSGDVLLSGSDDRRIIAWHD